MLLHSAMVMLPTYIYSFIHHSCYAYSFCSHFLGIIIREYPTSIDRQLWFWFCIILQYIKPSPKEMGGTRGIQNAWTRSNSYQSHKMFTQLDILISLWFYTIQILSRSLKNTSTYVHSFCTHYFDKFWYTSRTTM